MTKKPLGTEALLVQMAVTNKASLQRLARLIGKLEEAARRDALLTN